MNAARSIVVGTADAHRQVDQLTNELVALALEEGATLATLAPAALSPLQVKAVELWRANRAYQMTLDAARPTRLRRFTGRRVAHRVEISVGDTVVAYCDDAPVVIAGQLLTCTLRGEAPRFSAVQFAQHFTELQHATWAIDEARVRAWAEAQS